MEYNEIYDSEHQQHEKQLNIDLEKLQPVVVFFKQETQSMQELKTYSKTKKNL